jgi:hypothetical protein
MKLYELPNKTWFMMMEDAKVPPASLAGRRKVTYFFDHVDGMYSYCLDQQNNVYHFAAFTEVIPVNPPL